MHTEPSNPGTFLESIPMAAPKLQPRYTVDEYLAMERAADERHWYLDGEIFAIYLLRAQQRHGIGRRLMGTAFAALRDRGCRSAAAWVLRDNLLARGFYERLGGAVVGERTEPDLGVELAYSWRELAVLARAERNAEP